MKVNQSKDDTSSKMTSFSNKDLHNVEIWRQKWKEAPKAYATGETATPQQVKKNQIYCWQAVLLKEFHISERTINREMQKVGYCSKHITPQKPVTEN